MKDSLLRTVVILLAAIPVSAQTAPEEFAESIDVRVVNVEAVVTDRKGERVRGLQPEDFQLLVDGKEVPIEFFTEIVEGTAMSTPGSDGAEPPVAAAGPEAVGRSVLVFVDDKFTVAPQRNRVLKRVEESLAKLSDRDRVAVVAYNGGNLDLLTGWTADREEIAAALAKARERPTYGLHLRVRDALIPVSQTALAVAAAMRALPAPEGRKVMLLLSGGWPGYCGPIVETANLLGYTLYPVDVPGLQTIPGVEALIATPPPITGLQSSNGEMDNHYTLEVLAGETGGRSSLNSNRMAALERMVEDTASYYWLGFTPEWRADDRRHEIELKVRRPGLRVRNRSGFSDLSRQTETAMNVEGLLMFGAASHPDLAAKKIRIDLGEPRRAGWSTDEIPVTLTIPTDALTVVPVVEGYAIDATLALGALDPWGARAEMPKTPLRFLSHQEPRPGDVVRFQTTLRLRRRPQNVIFTVRDNLSGEMLWTNLGYKP